MMASDRESSNSSFRKDRTCTEVFDWKDQLRRQADCVRDRQSVGPHHFNIKDSYSRAHLNNMKGRGASYSKVILNKTNYSSVLQSRPRLSEGFDAEPLLKRTGIVKLNKKVNSGRNSHRESGYLKPTESLRNRQRQLGTDISVNTSTCEMTDSTVKIIEAARMAKITEHLHDKSHRSTTDKDKENVPADTNKQIQDIKNCLENLKTVHNSLKDKNKPPLRKPSHNPVLRLKKRENRDSSLSSSRLSGSFEARPETREVSKESKERLEKVEFLPYVAYGALSDTGIFRKYNEDRISVVERISKKSTPYKADSIFCIFDGHGGSACADYLKDSLFTLIAKSPFFGVDKVKALEEGFRIAETEFCKAAKDSKDFSGSCAIAALIDPKHLYIANVGDSRAILSTKRGIIQLSYDHKPESCVERDRILVNGGKVYRMRTETFVDTVGQLGTTLTSKTDSQVGPYRVEPGGLSVSRTIGDIRAKDTMYQGNPNCVVPTPEIRQYALGPNDEFIVLGCDGIFDVLSNEEVIKTARFTLRSCHYKTMNEADACERACKEIIETAKLKKSKDNLTVVLVMFRDLFYFK